MPCPVRVSDWMVVSARAGGDQECNCPSAGDTKQQPEPNPDLHSLPQSTPPSLGSANVSRRCLPTFYKQQLQQPSVQPQRCCISTTCPTTITISTTPPRPPMHCRRLGPLVPPCSRCRCDCAMHRPCGSPGPLLHIPMCSLCAPVYSFSSLARLLRALVGRVCAVVPYVSWFRLLPARCALPPPPRSLRPFNGAPRTLFAQLTQLGEGGAVKQCSGVLAEQGHEVARGEWTPPPTKGEDSREGQGSVARGQLVPPALDSNLLWCHAPPFLLPNLFFLMPCVRCLRWLVKSGPYVGHLNALRGCPSVYPPLSLLWPPHAMCNALCAVACNLRCFLS